MGTPSENPLFAPRKPIKGKPKKSPPPNGSGPYVSRVAPGSSIAPLPEILFPNYNPLNSTPLPGPSMPKKRFLRRIFPLIVTGAVGAYFLRRPSKKQLAGAGESQEVAAEVSSIPVEITEVMTSQETLS